MIRENPANCLNGFLNTKSIHSPLPSPPLPPHTVDSCCAGRVAPCYFHTPTLRHSPAVPVASSARRGRTSWWAPAPMPRRRAGFDTCRCRILLLFSLHAVGFCYSTRPPTAKQLFKADGSPTDAECRNEHAEAECNLWASQGECDANVGFMRRSCARACVSCGWVDSYCSDLVHSGQPAKRGTGKIAAMFERAATRTELGPTIHSSPATTGGPWVMTFDNFLDEGEAHAAARAPPASSEP